MAGIIRSFEKENSDISHAARKSVLRNVTNKTKVSGNVAVKPKALVDVKNTVYLRKNTSADLNLKKQSVFEENHHSKSEKFTKNDSSNILNKITLPAVILTSDNTDIEEEVLYLPEPPIKSLSDDANEFDVDDCPSCFSNDNDDDWLADLGPKKYSDDDIMNICCNSFPRNDPPSPQLNIDNWYKTQYEPMSPPDFRKLGTRYGSPFSSEFKLPCVFRSCAYDDIVPVTF